MRLEPFVVYLIVAPVVPVAIVMVTVPAYAPAAGVMTGVSGWMVKTLDAIALSVTPSLKAAALIVVVVDLVNTPVYSVDEIIGSDPSIVYLIVAPAVAVFKVMVAELVYVPAAGVIVGVSTCIVNMPDAISLPVIPPLNAAALIVVVSDRENAPVYSADVMTGSDPSVVYLIVAPDVPVAMVMVTELVYVPAEGVMVGISTCKGAVTSNFTALAAFSPIVVVTLTSYEPSGLPEGITAFTISVSLTTL